MKLKIIVLLSLLLINSNLFSHRVNIFCDLNGLTIEGEAYYSNGKSVCNGNITVFDKDKKVIGNGKTNKSGNFYIYVGKKYEFYKVFLNAGMGHSSKQVITVSNKKEVDNKKNKTELKNIGINKKELKILIEKKIKPLKSRIRELEKKIIEPDIVSIIGGIGWLVGIFSMLYIVRKKNAS